MRVRGHRGQSLVETALAVLFVAFVFLSLFKVSHLLTAKILVQHAAMRVARARTIGMNDFMCRKAARLAVVPVAGRRLWPEGDEFDYAMERGRFGNYLQAKDGAVARGILDYERWGGLSVSPGGSGAGDVRTTTSLRFALFEEPSVPCAVDGEARIENNAALYLVE